MAEDSDSLSRAGAAAALAVLTLINLFNYLDRYVVAALVESLKKSDLRVALSILGIHLLGDVPSLPLIGALSDATSLGAAFLVSPAVIALGGAIWLYAA